MARAEARARSAQTESFWSPASSLKLLSICRNPRASSPWRRARSEVVVSSNRSIAA
jgi:hypothetical protein